MYNFGNFSSSFGPTEFLGAPGNDEAARLDIIVRCTSAAALSTVLVSLTWEDENSVANIETFSLLLNTVTNVSRRTFPFIQSGSAPVNISALLLGLGHFEILWAFQGI